MKNVLSKVGLDVHKEKVLLALITPHTNLRHNLTEMLHVLGEQTGMKLSCIKPSQKSEVYL